MPKAPELDLGSITSPQHNLTGFYHSVLGHENCVLAEFYVPGHHLKQAVLVPENEQAPPHLRNSNVVTYRAPVGFHVVDVTITEGHFGEKHCLMANVVIEANRETETIRHIVCAL